MSEHPALQSEDRGLTPTPTLQIQAITKEQAKPFILDVHYAKRFPPHKFLFGLFVDQVLSGVICYGPPASPQVARSIFGGVDKERCLELNRLVITTSVKNAASFLVGRSLRLIPAPVAIVSYADGMMGHVGYIYQATNFCYTGALKAHDSYYMVDGKMVHPRSLASKGITAPKKWAKENGIQEIKPENKHRYVYFKGNKTELQDMKSKFKWTICPYPKGETKRYSAPNQFGDLA